MKPIELGGRLRRWSSGRGPLPVLLAARLRRLIDEGELPAGEPLPPAGIRTGPDRILVTNGAQQALSLLAAHFSPPVPTRRLAKAWHTYHPQARVTSPAALTV